MITSLNTFPRLKPQTAFIHTWSISAISLFLSPHDFPLANWEITLQCLGVCLLLRKLAWIWCCSASHCLVTAASCPPLWCTLRSRRSAACNRILVAPPPAAKPRQWPSCLRSSDSSSATHSSPSVVRWSRDAACPPPSRKAAWGLTWWFSACKLSRVEQRNLARNSTRERTWGHMATIRAQAKQHGAKEAAEPQRLPLLGLGAQKANNTLY